MENGELEKIPVVEKGLEQITFFLDLAASLAKIAAEVYGTAALHPHERFVEKDFSRFKGMEHSFFEDTAQACRDNFGMKLEMHGEVRPCEHDEKMLLMGNHPSFIAQWMWGVAVSHLAENTVAMGKKNLLWQPWMAPPLFAWVGALSGKLGFVSRSNHHEAVESSVKNACETVFVPGTAMILFVDKHRFTPENAKTDREKFSGIYPSAGIENWMNYTGMPSSSGVMEVVDATPNVRLINVTSGLDRPEPYNATFHVLIEEVSHKEVFNRGNIIASNKQQNITRKEKAFRGWQIKDFERKNEIIDGWQFNK